MNLVEDMKFAVVSVSVAAAAIMPAANAAGLSARSYVQDGLVVQFDGIENVGYGTHNSAATKWKSLVGSQTINLQSGASWSDRYFNAAVSGHATSIMPAYNTTSVSIEAAIKVTSQSSDQYPRIFAHQDLLTMRFNPGSSSVVFGINNSSTTVIGPAIGGGSAAGCTISGYSSSEDCGIFYNGSKYRSKGSAVTSTDMPSAAWYLNAYSGTLTGHYYALRFYNRALSAEEFETNFLIDRLRFWSFRYFGSGGSVNWNSIPWEVHEEAGGRTSPATTSYAQIVNSAVTVAASDNATLLGLSLEDGATLSLDSGIVVSANILYVEGAAVPRGLYTGSGPVGTPVSWISGAGIVRVAGSRKATFDFGLTARSYVQDGLVTHFDGIENVSYGTHNSAATQWKSLVGSPTISLKSGASFSDRYFDAAATGHATSIMPEYNTTNLTIETAIKVTSKGSADYPRIFAHQDRLTMRFNGSATVVRFGVYNSSTTLEGPSIGNGSTAGGTLSGYSSSEGWGIFYNGSEFAHNGTPVTSTNEPSAAWYLNAYSGTLLAHYYALRFYTRPLSADELRANALIDRLRFWSFAYDGGGAVADWSSVSWQVPEDVGGRTRPSSATNDFVQIKSANVTATRGDRVSLKGLSLEYGAKLTLDRYSIVNAKVLYVNGDPVERGVYTGFGSDFGTPVSWIDGDGIVRVAGSIDGDIPTDKRQVGMMLIVE